MLQFVAVITTGGLLLFSSALNIDSSIFLSLVNRIIDSKNLEANFILQALHINYLYDAILGLVFIIAWRKEITLDFPQKLLHAMSLEWKAVFTSIVWQGHLLIDAPDFEGCWNRAFQNWKEYVNKCDTRIMVTFDEKTNKKNKLKPKEKSQGTQGEKERLDEGNNFESTNQLEIANKLQSNKDKNVNSEADKKVQNKVKGESQSTTTEQTNCDGGDKRVSTKGEEDDLSNLSPRQILLRKQQERKNKSPKGSPKQEEDKHQARIWENSQLSKKDLANLDRSKKGQNYSPPSHKYVEEKEEKVAGFLDSDEEEEGSSTFLNKWVGKLKNIVGDKKITREDLSEVMAEFKQKLMEKNVAQQVAIQISEAVGETLLQTKTKTFTTVHKTVKEAMKEALRKVLTPKRKIDLVVEVTKEREKLKPYVIVFVGVNGVGKSTNLAKVAYKLKNAKLSVMLAACDNFRAGAVQQIETHGRNLGLPVFQRGYKEEPANIAYEAIKDATRKRIDAVLVDTAGRMQDNTLLMKELARLVRMNKPNLVIFIGEALVGNDAVDQITKFNRALQEESTDSFKPEIDAILLSKFDTVDDKVGTALSLIYSTSKPILYVGVGQKYPNLKELNVNTVVHSLLS